MAKIKRIKIDDLGDMDTFSYESEDSKKNKFSNAEGRPKKEKKDLQSAQIFINVTQSQKEEIKALAQKRGFGNISSFVRFCIMEQI